MTTLFERLGGAPAVDAAVDIFYDKVLADDRIKHFFVDTDMVAQHGHQKRFLTFAFGGAPSYSGKSMRAVHQQLVEKMGLTDVHFDAVVQNLGTTLAELNVPADLIQEVAAAAETLRADVLNR